MHALMEKVDRKELDLKNGRCWENRSCEVISSQVEDVEDGMC